MNPPRLALALLRAIVSRRTFEAVAGDLEESFRVDVLPRAGTRAARRWYWRQVVSLLAARAYSRSGSRRIHSAGQRGNVMAAMRQDLSYAVRALRKTPGFTAVALLTLALGIGANVAIFSLVYALLFKPLPFSQPDRLMAVHMLAPDRGAGPGVYREVVWSYPKYRAFKERQTVFESLALFGGREWSLTDTGDPERLRGELVGGTYFTTLGVTARLGRTFTSEEDRAGIEPVALISHGLWLRRFGGDASVLGRRISLNKVPHTVLGVMPAGFRGLIGEAEVWIPLMTVPAEDLEHAWSHSYSLIARRKAAVDVAQAEAATRVLGRQIDAVYPDKFAGGSWGAVAVPVDDQRANPIVTRSVFVLLGAVGLVLLIGCVNLANLMLTRGLARQREVAIRLALGAPRGRIVRQFMTESLLLSVAGAMAGLVVAYGALYAASVLMPDLRTVLRGPTAGLTRVGLGLLGLDVTVLAFTAALAIIAAVLFGMAPAWHASRCDLSTTMKAGGAGTGSRGTTRGFGLRAILIAGETALALVLLVAAGLMFKSLSQLYATRLGFTAERVVTFRLALPEAQYPIKYGQGLPDGPRALQLFEDLIARLRARPEIEAVSYGNCAPVSGGCNVTMARFPDRPPVAQGTEPLVGVFWASPDYFATLGIPLVRGRAFSDRDRLGQPKVIIVNETAARAFWKGEDPIGKRLGVGQGGFNDGAEVVGIVGDVRYGSVEAAPPRPGGVPSTSVMPDVYIPLPQSVRGAGLIFVRSRVTVESLVPVLRQEVQALDADLPLVEVKTMEERLGDATWRTRMSAWFLGAFAVMALVLASVGIFGVMAQSVAQRRREIGVRMALGAERRDILRLVIGRSVIVLGAGIVVGIVLSLASTGLLRALLHEVKPDDPTVLGMLSAVLLIVGLLASYVPARRATRVDPLETLRSE